MLKLADLAVREDFTLGPLRVSPALRFIKGPAGELHVEPLTMQVFLVLADAKGQVVTRNHLYDECWGGVAVGDYSLNRTITMVRRIAAEAGPGAFRIESIPRTGYRLLVDGETESDQRERRSKRPVVVAAGLVGLLLLSGTAWFAINRLPEPSVAVEAAAGSPSAELANAIASATLTTAATYQVPLRLLDENPKGADFALRVQDLRARDGRKVNLTLFSESGKAVLWNWSVTKPPEESASLGQLAKETGALVLSCAAETHVGRNRPDQETVKLYLDGCSKFEPWFGAEMRLLVDTFEKVTTRSPQLRGAWSKLFLSKAEAIEGLPRIDYVKSLKADIAASAARHIEVPETYIARAAVLPLNARFERLQLYDAGLARHPHNLPLMLARSWQLRSVGRMDDAAKTAGEAVALYPQSSAANAEYAKSLMHSGRLEAARSVLDRAEQANPGAPNLRSVRWVMEERYGDPARALDIARSGHSVVEVPMMKFLEARRDPTKANVDRAIAALMAGYQEFPIEPGWVAQALGTFGRKEEAIRFLLSYPYGGDSGDGAEMLFRPPLHEVRRDPRFMQIAKVFGVTDYWVKSGVLPDFCFEPDLPYDCKAELAKLKAEKKMAPRA